MKQLIHIIIFSLFCTQAITLINCQEPALEITIIPTPDTFFAGYSCVDITPDIDTPLGGFGPPGGFRLATGIHDNLYAQVAYVGNNADEHLFIITVDTVGYSYEFADWGPGVQELALSISEKLAHQGQIKSEDIIICSSHSESATDLIGFWQKPNQGPPKDYLDSLIIKITQSAQKAWTTKTQANLFFGKTVLNGYSDRYCLSDVLDNTITIMQAKTIQNSNIFTIANWAVHPTTMGAENTLVSADYIWGYREELQNRLGGGAMYIQGYIAAVQAGPGYIEGSGWDRVYNRGKIIADKVIEELPQLNPVNQFQIDNRMKVFECEAQGSFIFIAQGLGVLKRSTENRGGKLFVKKIPASYHRIGPCEIIGFPGEATPEYSLLLREKSNVDFQIMAGLANDEIGYIIDPQSIANDDGTLQEYHLQMGLGELIGPATIDAHSEMGWFAD